MSWLTLVGCILLVVCSATIGELLDGHFEHKYGENYSWHQLSSTFDTLLYPLVPLVGATFYLALGTLGIAFVNTLTEYYELLLSLLSRPILLFPAVFFGLLLYRMRGQYPFVYGLCELLVATLIIYLSMFPVTDQLATGDQSGLASTLLTKALGIIGGIYIVVRGMDNIDKGLPYRYRRFWNFLFHARSDCPNRELFDRAAYASCHVLSLTDRKVTISHR